MQQPSESRMWTGNCLRDLGERSSNVARAAYRARAWTWVMDGEPWVALDTRIEGALCRSLAFCRVAVMVIYSSICSAQSLNSFHKLVGRDEGQVRSSCSSNQVQDDGKRDQHCDGGDRKGRGCIRLCTFCS